MRFFRPDKFKIFLFILLLMPILFTTAYALSNCTSWVNYENNIAVIKRPCGYLSDIDTLLNKHLIVYILCVAFLAYPISYFISKLTEKKKKKVRILLLSVLGIINIAVFFLMLLPFIILCGFTLNHCG